MARDIKRQVSVATPDQPPTKKPTAAQLPTKKPIAVQVVLEPIWSSPPLLSHCRNSTQLIQDLFTKDEVPLIHTCCRIDEPSTKDLFKEEMGHREKQKDEDMIGSTSAEKDSKDEKV